MDRPNEEETTAAEPPEAVALQRLDRAIDTLIEVLDRAGIMAPFNEADWTPPPDHPHAVAWQIDHAAAELELLAKRVSDRHPPKVQ